MIAVPCGIKGCGAMVISRHPVKGQDFFLCSEHSEAIFISITEDLVNEKILKPAALRGAPKCMELLRRRRPSERPFLMEKLGLDN